LSNYFYYQLFNELIFFNFFSSISSFTSKCDTYYFPGDIRDTHSEMNRTDGAPDPTYGGLLTGDKSQWELSLDLLDKRLSSDLDAMIRTRSYFDYSEGRTQWVHYICVCENVYIYIFFKVIYLFSYVCASTYIYFFFKVIFIQNRTTVYIFMSVSLFVSSSMHCTYTYIKTIHCLDF